MFKLFALVFATVLVVAFAEPKPVYVANSYAAAPLAYSAGYAAAPFAYSAGYAAAPLAYNAPYSAYAAPIAHTYY